MSNKQPQSDSLTTGLIFRRVVIGTSLALILAFQVQILAEVAPEAVSGGRPGALLIAVGLLVYATAPGLQAIREVLR
jgi:hypothetical protein